MKSWLALVLLSTAACATVPPEGAPPTGDPGAGAGRCQADNLQDLVGRAASQELGAEALRRSGARIMRWIRPGDVVTMDYSEQRLNIRLDGQGRVEGFTCG